jgi:L-seryl-tRNA(Ser) seleniumtransferase
VTIEREPVDTERRLRQAATPVIARILDGRVLLDLRSVPPADDDRLAAAVSAAVS